MSAGFTTVFTAAAPGSSTGGEERARNQDS